jgi:hypothetical protein
MYTSHAHKHIANTHNITLSMIHAGFATELETILMITSLHFPTFVRWWYPSHLTGSTTSYRSGNLIPSVGTEFCLLCPNLIYRECQNSMIHETKLYPSVGIIRQGMSKSYITVSALYVNQSPLEKLERARSDPSRILSLPVSFKWSYEPFSDTSSTVNFLCQRN